MPLFEKEDGLVFMLTRLHLPSVYDATHDVLNHMFLAESKSNVCVELERGVGCMYFMIPVQHIILQTFPPTGSSQGCFNITMSSTFETIITVEGGVQTCFRCLFNGAVDPSTTWTFGNSQQPIGSNGMVTDGVLTVSDPTSIVPRAGADSFNPLRCTASDDSWHTALLSRRGNLTSVCACVCMNVCVCF